jgi:NhaP-type Na+/H+ or K+/H+ antiporter
MVPVLNVFDTGCAISWDGDFNAQTEEQVFSPVIDLALNCACFVYIGAWLPFESFNSSALGVTPWRLGILLLGILLLRRIPALLILYRWVPEIQTLKEAVFCGHFGNCPSFLQYRLITNVL